MIRVVVADDEPLVRSGIRAVLGNAGDIDVVAEAGDGVAAVDRVREHRPDVVLLDIRMPRLDGLAAAQRIRGLSARARAHAAEPGQGGTALVMLTAFGDEENVRRSLELDCCGFVLKSGDPQELPLAVRAAAAGAAYLSPTIAYRVIRRLSTLESTHSQSVREIVDRLTEREQDILRLLGQGRSNAEIAAQLHLTEGTVKGYVSTLLRKLGHRNRVQAAILAYRAGLVDKD